jgi:hypothetical protein
MDFQLESVHLNANNVVAKADNKQCTCIHCCTSEYAQLFFTGLPLHLDVKSVDSAISFHLCASFSIISIQSVPESVSAEGDTGEIVHTLKDDVVFTWCLQTSYLMIR